jgi:hypothetical protein
MPERDLRPSVNSGISDYLSQIAIAADPAAKVSDVEVLFWRGAVKPEAVAAYQKLVTDNLAQDGYAYHVVVTDTANGQTTTKFTIHSAKAGHLIGYWQTTPQGLLLNWAQVSGTGAPAAPPRAIAPADVTPTAPAANDKDAQIADLKRRLAEAENGKGAASTMVPAVTAAPTPDNAAQVSTPQATDNVPFLPLDQSDLVIKGADGSPVVAAKDGGGLDGFKLSQHDHAIFSPSIAVAPDGTIHVAFVEAHRTTYANAVYHRSSSDGGKTWTDAKNLSEDMPGIDVGHCVVLADSHNRVYVIWRAGLNVGWTIDGNLAGAGSLSNLWFRELDGGKWTQAKMINEREPMDNPHTMSTLSFFGVTDAAGRAQLLWNVSPDKWHPELNTPNGPAQGILPGLVFQSTFDGATAGTPRQVFLAAIVPPKAYEGPSCDGLDTINGYVDASGAAHFVAKVDRPQDGGGSHPTHYELIENGKAGQSIDLPNASFHESNDVPTLLVDAKGRQHMIALFLGGEHPNIRDYLLGSEDEPTVIRAAAGLNGTIQGFQACQGPGGRMVALMQMNDTNENGAGDNFLSISTGDGKWSVPVNITNNAGRQNYVSKDTSAQSQVALQTGCEAGGGAVAFDKEGHLLLVVIKKEFAIVHSTAFGVNLGGGGSTTPTLRFLRF